MLKTIKSKIGIFFQAIRARPELMCKASCGIFMLGWGCAVHGMLK